MSKLELYNFFEVFLIFLESIKNDCQKNDCNSCLLNKDYCLFEKSPSDWDLDLIKQRMWQIIEIKKRGDE